MSETPVLIDAAGRVFTAADCAAAIADLTQRCEKASATAARAAAVAEDLAAQLGRVVAAANNFADQLAALEGLPPAAEAAIEEFDAVLLHALDGRESDYLQ